MAIYTRNVTLKNILKISLEKNITALTSSSVWSLLETLDPQRNFNLLFLVLENVEKLYPILKEINLDSDWIPTRKALLSTQDTASALIKNRNLYSFNLPDLDLNQRSRARDKRTAALDRIFKDAPFWTVMGYQPVQKKALKQFYILLAYLWLSREIIMGSPAEQIIQPSLLATLAAIRDLTKDPNSTEIFKLPTNSLSPDEYLEHLQMFPENSPVQLFAYFLEDAIDIHRNIPTVPDDDLSPEDSDLVTKTGPTTDILSPVEEDPASPKLTTIASQRKTGFLLRNFSKIQIRRWIAQKNQLFPFSGRTLSDHELKLLLQFLTEIKHPFDDIEDVEAMAMLSVLFWGPLSIDRLSRLKVADELTGLKTEDDSYNPHTGALTLLSPWPKIKYTPDANARHQLHPRQKWIPLPLPDVATKNLNLYLEKTNRKYGQIFQRSPEQVRLILSNLVSNIYHGSHFRVTTTGIYMTFVDRLSRMPNSDPTSTALITGDLPRSAETKVHYAAFYEENLQKTYLDCRSLLLDQFGICAATQNLPTGQRLNYLGTPKRPKPEIVKSALINLIDLVRRGSQDKIGLDGFVYKHNAYVTYVTLLLNYAVGFRSVSHPYIESQQFDPVSGFCSILDKDINNGNHSRPVWIPNVCIKQLSFYRNYLDRLVSFSGGYQTAHEAIEKSDRSSLFLLKQKADKLIIVPVEPSTIQPILTSVNYHIPLNSQRHYFKSVLQESGCPADAIELFLGHWDHGEEGYSISSALDPHTYKELINKHLTRALDNLGLTPVRGPRRSGWHFQIPLENIPLNPSAQHSKKRVKKRQSKQKQQLEQELRGILPDTFLKKMKATHIRIIKKARKQLPDLFDVHRREELGIDKISNFFYGIDSQNRKRRTVYTEQQVFLRLIKATLPDISLEQIPPPPMMIKPEPSLVRANVGNHLYQYRQLAKNLVKQIEELGVIRDESSMEKIYAVTTQQGWLGLIYTCAIVFGGILSEKWAAALPEGLHKKIFLYKDLMWVDLWSGGDAPEDPRERFLEQRNPHRYRRWVPDPITQALIIQWRICSHIHPLDPEALPLESTLSAHLTSFDCLKSVREPSYVKHLIQLGIAAALIHLPPFMIAYATNRLPSANLPDERWFRVNFNKQSIVPESKKSVQIKYSRKRFLLSDQKQIRLTLCKIIDPSVTCDRGKIDDAKMRIENFLNKHKRASPIVKLLAQWALFLLTHRDGLDSPHRKTDELAMSTTRTYVTNIGNILIETFRWQNPLIIDEDELLAIYQSLQAALVKKSRTSGKKLVDSNYDSASHKFISTFNLFHWYLEKTFGVSFEPAAPLIDSFRHDKRTISQVSAQLILPNEYRRLLEIYNFTKIKRIRLDSIACCILILAYRMGLRRSEILGLRIKDALLAPLQIRVAKHKGRRTKTPCATRDLPEYLPFPKDERDFLIQWITQRRAEPKVKATSYLFTENKWSNEMLDDHQLVPEILKNLKSITGDPDTTLHHCRHSFYSNLMIQSVLTKKIPLITVPAFVHQGCPPGDKYWSAVMGSTGTARTKMHALTMLSGHAAIDVGMNTYMNLSDWLLGYLLRHPGNSPPLSGLCVAKLFNVSIPTGHEILREQRYPFAAAMLNICKKNIITDFQVMEKNTVESKKKKERPTRRVTVFDDFETAYGRAKKMTGLKKIRTESVNFDEIKSNYIAIVESTHGSRAKKILKIASGLSSQLKINIVNCRSYQFAREFIWLLEILQLSPDQINPRYHLPPKHSDPTNKRGLEQLKRWRTRVPKLDITLTNKRTKYKNGIIRIHVKDRALALINLLSQ